MNTKNHVSLAAASILLFASAINFQMTRAVGQEKVYTGMCDASAAVDLDANNFIVANDEDNILRIYNQKITNRPFQEVSLAKVFSGEIKDREDGKDLEIDLEGAARIEDKIFWIGSHSTSQKGKFRPARHRLFALQIKPDVNGKFVTERVGKIYTTLITDLEKDTRFDKYKFNEAKKISPKEIGGLSIEGLAATPEGTLLIGFRNPLIGGKVENGRLVGANALIVKLVNPLEVIKGKAARFGDPIELNLGGYGIRSLEFYKDKEYIIVAGSYHENSVIDGQKREESRLYLWSEQPRLLEGIKLNDLNIEAIFFYVHEGKEYAQMLSDDGKSSCNNGFRSQTEIMEPR